QVICAIIRAKCKMDEITEVVTVEDVRKLALPLGTRVITGDGLLNSPATWTTVIYSHDSLSSKTIQPGEIVLVAGTQGSRQAKLTDTEVIRWAADKKASAVVLTLNPSPSALAEAKAYRIPLMVLPDGSRVRMVEKTIVSLMVDHKGQVERRGTQ